MLVCLTIRNLALVDHIVWKPGTGFNCVTGETGAGKSLLIGALGLALGDKVDKTMIREGATTAIVEAVFSLTSESLRTELHHLFDRVGVDFEPEQREVIIKRQITLDQPGRQWINGSAVTLTLLRDIGEKLVDFHGPHEHQSLLKADVQQRLLDEFAGASELAQQVLKAWKHARQTEADLKNLEEQISLSESELAKCKEALQEITDANLKENEEEEISIRLATATQGARILEICSQLANELDGAQGAFVEGLQKIQKLVRELRGLDPSHKTEPLSELAATLQTVAIELARSTGDYGEQIDTDPEQLSALSERYHLIQVLKKKYGQTIKDVLNHAKRASEKISRFENKDKELEAAKEAVQQAEQNYRRLAEKLSEKRRKAADLLSTRISETLLELNFNHAVFQARVQASDPSGNGLETVEFMFAPNVGEGLRPLKAIASSGEMARVMLAIKTTLAEQDSTPLLVFDEVDANIGGETSIKIANKLRELGSKHQVLCITHLPQVAAAAHSHYCVIKNESKNRTTTAITQLSDHERLEELARMLGKTNDSAKKLAKSLLTFYLSIPDKQERKKSPYSRKNF